MFLRMGRARVALSAALALSLWTGIAIARSSFLVRPGLRGDYFTSADWSGTSARSTIDADISTSQLSRGWGFTPPDVFSIRWSGYLFVDRPGMYTFATSSDDGSAIYIDNTLVVDNGGAHGAITREGRARITRGPHEIVIQYTQAGGPYQLELSWAREGQPLATVPSWLLSTRPRTKLTLAITRLLDWLWLPLGLVAILLAARLAVLIGHWRHRDERDIDTAPLPWRTRRAFLVLVLFLVCAIVQTWPLATDPAHLSRNDNADAQLNEWTLAWFAHELPRDPLHLFDGNMFFPEHRTVAFSEAMFVQGVMAAPPLWAGASPVLAYNIVLLAGFTLTAWATCLVVAQWTDDWIAGIAAGVMMAFNAHTLTRLAHLQAQHAEFLPLALWWLDALLRRPRWRSAIWLAIWFTLQALTSVYLLVFTAIALVVATIVRPDDWFGRRFAALAPKVALSAGIAGVLLAPYLFPYWKLHSEGFVRSLDEVGFYAAGVRDYLTTPSRFHEWAGGQQALFPGIVALVLASVTIGTLKAFTDRRARMCLAFGLCGVLLSFGPAIAPGYELLYSTIPLVQGIRTTARFGYLGLVAVAVLGGYGVVILRRHVLTRTPRLNTTVSIALVALVFLEPLAIPIVYEPFIGIASIYRLPAANPRAIVVEMPIAPPDRPFRNAPYVLGSTLNWKPLINGYSGFTPESYTRHYVAMRDFPEAAAIAAMQAVGVTDVFVDLERIDQAALDGIAHQPSLHRVALEGSVALYQLDSRR